MSNLNDPLERKIVHARVSLIMTSGMEFFGHLAMRLFLRRIEPQYCRSMATDGRYLYYNPVFVEKANTEELKSMIGHIVLHCSYDHISRRGRRDKKSFAQASDYIANIDLTDHGIGRIVHWPKDETPIVPFYDERFRGMSTDEVYEILITEKKSNGGDGGKKKGDGKGKGKGQGPCGSPSDFDGDPDDHSYDTHLDPREKKDPKSGYENYSEEEANILGDEIRQATLNAAKKAGAGNTPAGIRRMLKDLLEPQVDWTEYLATSTLSLIKSDYTFSKPNRRNSSMGGIILPGSDVEQDVDVCCAIDTSGSISDEMLREFISEIKGIMEQFKSFKLRLWCFDAAAYQIWEFDNDNIDDIHDFTPEGGGGTDFMVNWDLMKKNEIEPDQLIIFTDGYPCGDWGIEEYQENLIYLISGSKDIVAPIGVTLYYE